MSFSSEQPGAPERTRAITGRQAAFCLVHHRGTHTWRFVWTQGEDRCLLREVMELARDPEVAFDWFDAALVVRELARKLTREKDDSLAGGGGLASVYSRRNQPDSPGATEFFRVDFRGPHSPERE